MPQTFTNHLIHETSPYLLQHAHNPVEWYPWSSEAFERARRENKPVLLSIGYAACHWCHVMEHESFEDAEIARIMNEKFVNIKVDREERPDVDQVYMAFIQMFTGSGGWPMTVFLTPDKKPFFGGTYFPPDDRYGRPGFKRVLQMVADYYHKEKDKVSKMLEQVDEAYQKLLSEQTAGSMPDRTDWNKAVEVLSGHYEPQYGGIGGAPKFPASGAMELFLRKYRNGGERRYLDMVAHTLQKMAEGGIFDQLGGGFARYSVDDQWLVPHFEKMLYDNARLAALYFEMYRCTQDSFYSRIAEETLAFVQRELRHENGGFFSSLDADSEGEEGKYYVWSRAEVLERLGKEQGVIVCDYFDISEQGNFEGRNILHVNQDIQTLADKYNMDEGSIIRLIEEARLTLFDERKKRVRPNLDDKMIVSWNGLMLSAFSIAYQVTRREAYAEVIVENIAFVQQNLVKNGRLLHTFKDGQAKYDGFLDDYANWIQGLLDAYEALFDGTYLQWAYDLTQKVNAYFWDRDNGGYFYTASDQEALIRRMKDEGDQSIPSGNGIMLSNQLRLFSFTEERELIDKCEIILRKYGPNFSRHPFAYASYLNAFDFYLEKPREILVALPDRSEIDESLWQTIFNRYRPNKVIMVKKERVADEVLTASLTEGRSAVEGRPTVYVCHDFNCSLPLHSAEEVNKLLDE